MNTFGSVTNIFLLLCSLPLLLISLTEAEYITFQPSSLLPSAPHSTCKSSSSSSKGRRPSSLQVSHRYGPCSPLDSEMASVPTLVEILEHDKERVESIKDRIRPKSVEVDRARPKTVGQEALGLPAKSGYTLGTGNFIVTVGFGTPKTDLSLAFDTGSDLTWTQCAPCAKSCYQQVEPIFNPSKSSTYANITCSSQFCAGLNSATLYPPACSSSTCIYTSVYGDNSFSRGFFAKDTLTLGTGASIPNFYFGCGEYNAGLFGGTAGILGLGRDKLSAVSQSASTYGNYFSYCLPSSSSSTGHLTFGTGGTVSKALTYTSLLTRSEQPSFYFVDLQGISVGGSKLEISPTVFSSVGTVIDSGTVITRLPPQAYSALKGAFSAGMSKYPHAPASGLLDTCYDLSNYTEISVPKISLLFGGGVSLDLPLSGILLGGDISQVCLAFAGNSDGGDVGIIGNTQQKTFDVVYDVAGGKLGFGPAGCM